jgi:signal transduction histidine kinase
VRLTHRSDRPKHLLPGSLFGRLTLILVAGLLSTQLISLMLHLQERAALLGLAGAHSHAGALLDGLPGRFALHLALSMVAVIGVSLIAVRWVTRPLQQLAEAATAFAHDLDAAPLHTGGPAEVQRAAEAFNFMQQRLRQLVQDRSRALAAVSHDLRTPLTRLRLRTELVGDPALQDRLNADIDTMQAMINSVLAYLRGQDESEPVQRIDMAALLHSLVEDEHALGRPVRLLNHLEPVTAITPYAGRLSMLKRAITNLIDNAVTHGSTVQLALRASPEAWTIVVEDDGPGIAPADLQRVTEPFVRLDNSRNLATGGVGLGLTIVRDAALRHGGRLELTNRPQGGLRATLVLPRMSSP